MSVTVTVAVEYAGLCYTCGTPIHMESTIYRRCHERGEEFFCPNGHGQVYRETISQKLAAAQADIEKLRGEILVRDVQIARRDKEARRLALRAQAGMCSQCHRTFQNVARHMTTKHGVSA